MKYLKIYESFTKRTLMDWYEMVKDSPSKRRNYHRVDFDVSELWCDNNELTSLKGIEYFKNIKKLYCHSNNLTSLKGIENSINLIELDCNRNELTSIIDVKYLINLESFWCFLNKLTNLEGVENLINLKRLFCSENKLTNLKEIENLPNLYYLDCDENPFEFPLPKEIRDKFINCPNIYTDEMKEYFQTYEYQKKFLTLYPERANDLKEFGFHEKIKEEFPDLIEGSEFGFFNLR